MKRLPTLVLLAAALVAVAGARHELKQTPRFVAVDPDMTVLDAGYVQLLALGHDALAADLVLARALTYFGAHYAQRATFPFANMARLFDTACRLDPQNIDAFLMGANLTGSSDPRAALALLRLGNQFHPGLWKFPEMIGFRYFFYLKNNSMAARYYEAASRLPGRPPMFPPWPASSTTRQAAAARRSAY